MEDVDQIILFSLKETGLELEDDVQSLKQCSVEQIVEMIIFCLKIIYPDLKMSTVLPPSMSARFNLCAEIARLCKDMDYKGEIGYHTILYFNEFEIRKLLVFLLEHLPRDMAPESQEPEVGGGAALRFETGSRLKEILSSETGNLNTSGVCSNKYLAMPLESGTLLPGQKIDCQPIEWRDFVAQQLPYVNEQLLNQRMFYSSIISLNSRGVSNPLKLKQSKLDWTVAYEDFNLPEIDDLDSYVSAQSNITFSAKTVNDEIHKKTFCTEAVNDDIDNKVNDKTRYWREDAINFAELNDKPVEESKVPHVNENCIEITETDDDTETLVTPNNKDLIMKGESNNFQEDQEEIDLKQDVYVLTEEIRTLSDKIAEIKRLNGNGKMIKEHKSSNSILCQAIDYLKTQPDVSNLQIANEKFSEKLTVLYNQWEPYKEVFTSKYLKLKEATENRSEKKHHLANELLAMQKEFDEMTQKLNFFTLKQKEYDSMSKGIGRNEYTQRILEIIGNVRKQETEINKILGDTTVIQKEINTISGKINRSFDVAEQLLKKNISVDEASREAHGLLVQLHNNFSDILEMVTETGVYLRDIRNLEEQIADNSVNIEESLSQVREDVKRIKDEQYVLIDRLRNILELNNVDYASDS